MPLPLTVSCFSKIQIGFTFLVPAHPGSPGKRAVKRVCVCVLSVCVYVCVHCCQLCTIVVFNFSYYFFLAILYSYVTSSCLTYLYVLHIWVIWYRCLLNSLCSVNQLFTVRVHLPNFDEMYFSCLKCHSFSKSQKNDISIKNWASREHFPHICLTKVAAKSIFL